MHQPRRREHICVWEGRGETFVEEETARRSRKNQMKKRIQDIEQHEGLSETEKEWYSKQLEARQKLEHVQAPGHEWDGQDVLVAVNIDRARNTAKFDIADPSNSEYDSVQALFENRGAIVVLNGSFTDEFEPMDTHVYLLNKCASR